MKKKMKNDKQYRVVTEYNYKIGDKVVRGRDWKWGDEDKDSVYGVIYAGVDGGWLSVSWINYKGRIVNKQEYEVGPNQFDLYFYE